MSESSLKQKLISGVLWKGMERICAQLVSTVVAIVLARILVPDDYSVVSIATIFFTFCNLFISSGLNTALIQKKNADKLDYSTIFVTNMSLAIIMYLIMFFSAPYIAAAYHKPIVVPVIRVMALTFFINAYKSVLSAKISSDMKFKRFFMSTIIGTVISAVVGIFMASRGFGVWALVAQQMTNSFIDSLILTFTTRYFFGFSFSFERFKSLFAFGGRIFVASIISVIYDECRPLIVGLRFSTVDLAFYNKGMTFPSLINSIGNNTLSTTLFPAMAKVQDDKSAILAMTRRFMQLSSFVIFPMMFGLMAVSTNFVKVVLTDKWLPIVPYLMIFSFSYMLDLIQIGNLQAIKALGRSDLILKLEIIKKVSYAVVIVLAVVLSPSPIVLAASAIVTSIIATVVNTYPNKKLIGYSFVTLFADILPNMIPSLIMFAVVYLMNYIKISLYLLLLLQVLCGIVIYLVIILITKNQNLKYFIEQIKPYFQKFKTNNQSA